MENQIMIHLGCFHFLVLWNSRLYMFSNQQSSFLALQAGCHGPSEEDRANIDSYLQLVHPALQAHGQIGGRLFGEKGPPQV